MQASNCSRNAAHALLGAVASFKPATILISRLSASGELFVVTLTPNILELRALHEFLQRMRRPRRAAYPRGRQPPALGLRKLQDHSLRKPAHDRGLRLRVGQ